MADFKDQSPSKLETSSDRSISGEKPGSAIIFQNTDDTDLPDPDEGKTPEERAAIVRRSIHV